MDPWKQGLVMPQVAGTELLVARTVQWLCFNLHTESHFNVQVESQASHVKTGLRGHGNQGSYIY
jgi:hypothetical protein